MKARGKIRSVYFAGGCILIDAAPDFLLQFIPILCILYAEEKTVHRFRGMISANIVPYFYCPKIYNLDAAPLFLYHVCTSKTDEVL